MRERERERERERDEWTKGREKEDQRIILLEFLM